MPGSIFHCLHLKTHVHNNSRIQTKELHLLNILTISKQSVSILALFQYFREGLGST